MLLNCAADVLGPLTTDQAPVPFVGVLAANVAEPVTHNVVVWSGPAFAVVGGALTVITTSSVESGHGVFEIVHRRVYVPAPPAGVKVAVGLVVLLNCAAEVFGPLTTDQLPVPTLGALAANVAEPVEQIV